MRKPSPFPGKPASARPRKPGPTGLSYPAFDFAKAFDMLTAEEIEACENDTANVVGSILAYDRIALGQCQYIQLYQGRRFDILADRLLGLEQED